MSKHEHHEHEHCEHKHEHAHEHSDSASRNILTAFLLNFLFVIIETAGGIFTNSVAILSDAVHDLGDCLAIGFAYALEKKSRKKPDAVYTYGYRRYSILSALITAFILLVGSAFVIYSSVMRIINIEHTELRSGWMCVIAVLGVIINGTAVLRTSHGHGANERSISLHMLEDVLGWVVVLIGSVLIKIFDLPIIDPILSICVGLFILYHAVRNVHHAICILLEKAPAAFDEEKFRAAIMEIDGVEDVHHIHAWSLDGENVLCTAHAVVADNATVDMIKSIKHSIKHKSAHCGVGHLTLEIDFHGEECGEQECHIHEAPAADAHGHSHGHGHAHSH